MAGLLDWMQTPVGMGLLSAVAGGMAGARRGTPINNIGRGLVTGVQGYAGAQDMIRQEQENAFAKQYKTLQMQELESKIAQQKAQQEWKAGLPGMMAPKLTGSTDQGRQLAEQNAAFGQEGLPALVESAQYAQSDAPINMDYGVDKQAMQAYMMQPNSPYAEKLMERELFPAADNYKVVGDSLIQIGSNGVKPVYTKPEKIDPNKPFMVVDGRVVPNPDYQQYELDKARSGATNVTNRIENKVGDSMAAQVGPMLKASTEKTTGAINLANSSRLMVEALDNGNAYIGPTANARLKLAQFGQVLGVGGKTEAEKINNTRQLIRGLAEGAVEARKELAGQGQVTESEAAAVQKAYSGNIEDLTAGEVRLIAGLNIKREKLARQRHQRVLKEAPQTLQPYFQVDPEAPANPGGGWGIQRVK